MEVCARRLLANNTVGGRWGTVDAFLHFQLLLFQFKSKQAQFVTQWSNSIYTQYHAKTWKQCPSEKFLQPI